MSTPVLITGSGIISAIGIGKQETLQSLRKGHSGIGPISHLQTIHKDLPTGEVCLSNAQMHEMLGIPLDRITSRTTLMGILALREALAEAGIDAINSRMALVSGTTVGGMDITEQYFGEMLTDDAHLSVLRSHDCGSSSEGIADYFGIPHNQVYTLSTACSSAANALIMGARLIETGRADIVIAGGSESLSRFHLNGFNTLMILDKEPCRPFDETRVGLNLGEGAAFIVLESASSANCRKVKPIATLAGYGNACDAYHQTASSPDGEGAYKAMNKALNRARLQPRDIQYVNAHGTGTPNNDQSESHALQRIFGQEMPPVSSTKSMTGHTTSASGSIESVICLLALQHQFIPANVGWHTAMTDGILPTQGQEQARLQHVMCNSFGFGGNDSSIVLSSIGNDFPTNGEQQTNKKKVYVRSLVSVSPTDEAVDCSAFIPKLEARRLCRLLKTSIYTSMTALQEADLLCPDAIIIGTAYGMLENSEKFLLQMCQEGEEMLKPTLFMQSTHNTIAGQLAIRTQCHGYNVTYTQGTRSLECALLDAVMQLEEGVITNALVGCHDETTPLFAELMYRLTGKQLPVGVSSVAAVLTTTPENSLFELKELTLPCGT